MSIRVVHLVNGISATSIPVELANYLNKVKGIKSDIISINYCESLPDIVQEHNIAINGVQKSEKVVDFIKMQDYDILNTHHNAFSKVSRDIFRKVKRERIKCVNTQHGNVHYTLQRKSLNLISFLYADAIIYNSHSTASAYTFFEKLLISAKPQKVIHLGVNTEKTENYVKPPRNNIKRISTNSSLKPVKNHITLLKAMKYLGNKKIHLDIVGGGRSYDILTKEVRRLGIEKKVTFYGYLNKREDLYKIISNSDISVFPSLSESFCVAAAEAMAVGLPVICSNIDAFHEVIGDNGIFVNAKDALGFANEIEKLMNNPQSANELGRRNRERILKNFTLDKTAVEHKKFYESILN